MGRKRDLRSCRRLPGDSGRNVDAIVRHLIELRAAFAKQAGQPEGQHVAVIQLAAEVEPAFVTAEVSRQELHFVQRFPGRSLGDVVQQSAGASCP